MSNSSTMSSGTSSRTVKWFIFQTKNGSNSSSIPILSARKAFEYNSSSLSRVHVAPFVSGTIKQTAVPHLPPKMKVVLFYTSRQIDFSTPGPSTRARPCPPRSVPREACVDSVQLVDDYCHSARLKTGTAKPGSELPGIEGYSMARDLA